CSNSLQSHGKEFRRCSGCNVAPYCSKNCQSVAWNSEQFPHKNICKILQNIVAVAGTELLFPQSVCEHASYPYETRNLVVEKWQKGDVSLDILMEIEEWSTFRSSYVDSRYLRTECLPGFDDYDAKLDELSKGNSSLKRTRFFRFRFDVYSYVICVNF
ncbi:hypothetical protein BDN70DRAFT_980709, partial [Pholiota conissans]